MDYRSVIESKYRRESWLELLHDIFRSGANFRTTPITVNANSPLAVSSLQLGTITLADDNKIAVYEIKLSDSVDIIANRVGIRNLLHNDWRAKGCVGAFMFCYRENESVLRFSYVSSTFKFNEDGHLERDETDTKRFTYLLGAGHRSRTAIKQFEDLKSSSLLLADITKAFSIEALGDRFFKDYKKIYEDIIEFVTGKRFIKVSNKWEEKEVNAPNSEIMGEFSRFSNPEKAVRDYVKNLMGRIVFLQFIQKKGWLGVPANKEWGEGDKEFLQNLYDRSNKENFIDEVLETLFNDINKKRENDIANSILGENIKVPYLNGGLFQRDKADECAFKLPKRFLDEMFKFFSSYNFTIDENDPEDAEIGVDPEMLGRIFENLLEDNKDKGAFYTPKEIVQYMCRESLIGYLQTDKDQDEKRAIRSFVLTYNTANLNETLKSEIDQKLKDVKICDPAIGSGAFPMGLLKELYACRSVLEGLEEDKAAEIKKHIIQNSIYGVDIEKGAVDIARLRFWLSIIVDEKTPHALPNMDFKIMQGNSLIPTFGGKYVNLTDKLRHVNSSKIRNSKKKLFELQQEFYNAEGEQKLELLIQIKFLILEIVKLQMDYEYNKEVEDSARTMDLFNPQPLAEVRVDESKRSVVATCLRYQRELSSTTRSLEDKAAISIPFFDWKIMFPDIFNAERMGFDIVIGNPPYISAVNMARSEFEKNLYKSLYPEATGAYDMYILFLLLGASLSNNIYTWIIPNKLHVAEYARQTKETLIQKNGLKASIDVSIYDVFKTASVYPIIILGNKSSQIPFTEYILEKYEDLLANKLITRDRSISINFDRLSNLGIQACSGATGFEAQKIKEYVRNGQDNSCIPFTVSGNIDRYYYNNINVRYMKGKYSPAYIYLSSNIAETKIKMWCSPKIVIAGMTKQIEAVYVNDPLAIGVGVYAITDFNGYDPYFILGVLNAKSTTEFLIKEFSDKHLAGGYLAINKSTIEQLAFPKNVPTEIQDKIAQLAKLIQEKKLYCPTFDTSTYEEQIDSYIESII